jgi:hypothetical protein
MTTAPTARTRIRAMAPAWQSSSAPRYDPAAPGNPVRLRAMAARPIIRVRLRAMAPRPTAPSAPAR